MFQNLFNGQIPAGLLSDEEQNNLNQQTLLNLGLGLLANSGPSPTRTTFGQAFGHAGMNALNGRNQSVQELLKNKMVKQQFDDASAAKAREAKLAELVGSKATGPSMGASPSPGTGLVGAIDRGDPNAYQDFYANMAGLGGDYTKMGLGGLEKIKGVGAEAPMSVREWQYYNSLPPADQARYLDMKRQNYDISSIAGVPNVVRRGAFPTKTPISTLKDEATGKSTLAGAQKAGEVAGGAQADAQVNLGTKLDEINKLRTNVQGLLKDKGFNSIYGLNSVIDPSNYIRGTDAANAAARREQLDAESFGVSIKSMRGMGSLSDAEGKKVTAAYTRANNPRISADDARKAWGEVLSYLDLAEKRARQQAAGDNSGKTIVNSGTFNGRRVNKYSDGTVEYAD